MSQPKLVSMDKVSLKTSNNIYEKIIQDYIYNNPSCLGLGELSVLTKERRQPTGGIIDFLMTDDKDTRYEIEIQLGATDPSHIIRTIEYWDIEKKRYPQYDHVAVIVAEEITGRFMNVIQLFNGHLPIIALQLSAYKKSNDELALIFTKVLDRIIPSDDDEYKAEPADRKFWESKSSPKIMGIMDNIFTDCETLKGYEPKYNKPYIGLIKNNALVLKFYPKKIFMYFCVKVQEIIEQYKEQLDNSNLDYELEKDKKFVRFKFNTNDDYTKNKEIIDILIDEAVKKIEYD